MSLPPEAHAVLDFWFLPEGDPQHRNAILGRESTPEELAFLREHGSRF